MGDVKGMCSEPSSIQKIHVCLFVYWRVGFERINTDANPPRLVGGQVQKHPVFSALPNLVFGNIQIFGKFANVPHSKSFAAEQ